MIEDPVVHRTTLDALKTFDPSRDVLVILTHDARRGRVLPQGGPDRLREVALKEGHRPVEIHE